MEPTIYYDNGRAYLELHAMMAPLGPYYGEFSEENDTNGENYEFTVDNAVMEFELTHHVTIYRLGRSARHICIEDTPRNRRRYKSLQAKAIAAAKELWDMMRDPSRVVVDNDDDDEGEEYPDTIIEEM